MTEKDKAGVESMAAVDGAGRKDDKGKLRWDLMPAEAVEEVVKVLTYGTEKYAAWNWARGMKWSRLFGAMMRHAWAWWRGEDIDPESGIHHLAHVGCGVMFLLQFAIKRDVYKDFDDRPVYGGSGMAHKEIEHAQGDERVQ